MEAFTLHIGVFDGPLDLLLQLIERRELDVTTVSLAKVADLYLEHVHAVELDPDALAEFIAVAAKLLLIKSAVLLPRPPEQPVLEVDDPTDLTERLREYQRIRDAAQTLKEREESGLRSFPRLAPLEPPPVPLQRDGGKTDDLLRALARLAAEAARRMPEEPIEREEFSIGDKMELLRERTRRGERLSFLGLLAGRRRGEIVATFLAVLELLRLGEIEIAQAERFGDIAIAAP